MQSMPFYILTCYPFTPLHSTLYSSTNHLLCSRHVFKELPTQLDIILHHCSSTHTLYYLGQKQRRVGLAVKAWMNTETEFTGSSFEQVDD